MGKNKEWAPLFFSVVQIYFIFTQATIVLASFSGHTGCYVTATCRGEKSLCVYRSGEKLLKQAARQSQQQIALCEERIFVKIFASATEFYCNKSHKFSLIRLCETCCPNKILLKRQRFSQKFSRTNKRNLSLQCVEAKCCCNLSVSIIIIKSTHLRFWQIQSHRAL